MLTIVAYTQTVSLVVKLHCLPVGLLIRNSATYLSPLADVVKHFWKHTMLFMHQISQACRFGIYPVKQLLRILNI